ncbi:hypothetical protein L596_022826 [Steinernema carpocapsae]|uniref:Uncharacterized protein n=1 Tax=Steinernema carpocapsae TaxID=34508 RepID=A0A4V6A0B3_STECR|nr:hypothetical protein L596_022826 [Steinernema carpocapsae]
MLAGVNRRARRRMKRTKSKSRRQIRGMNGKLKSVSGKLGTAEEMVAKNSEKKGEEALVELNDVRKLTIAVSIPPEGFLEFGMSRFLPGTRRNSAPKTSWVVEVESHGAGDGRFPAVHHERQVRVHAFDVGWQSRATSCRRWR